MSILNAIYNAFPGGTGNGIAIAPVGGTKTEVAGVTMTAGAVAYTYAPTVAAGFTSIQATAVQTADVVLVAFQYEIMSVNTADEWFLRVGKGLATAETIVDKYLWNTLAVSAVGVSPQYAMPSFVRNRFSAAANNRLSGSLAVRTGVAVTVVVHGIYLTGV